MIPDADILHARDPRRPSRSSADTGARSRPRRLLRERGATNGFAGCLVFWFSVKTTLELPDDLMREVKIRAAKQDRRLKDLVAELLRRGLAEEESTDVRTAPRRVRLPLIVGGHAANPDDEMTPERLAEVLLADDLPAR